MSTDDAYRHNHFKHSQAEKKHAWVKGRRKWTQKWLARREVHKLLLKNLLPADTTLSLYVSCYKLKERCSIVVAGPVLSQL